MKVLIPTTQYRKDLKKYAHQTREMEALTEVLRCLSNERPLPVSCRPHRLLNEYRGCLECHVGSDFLLIWMDDESITLVRLGSHSELFR